MSEHGFSCVKLGDLGMVWDLFPFTACSVSLPLHEVNLNYICYLCVWTKKGPRHARWYPSARNTRLGSIEVDGELADSFICDTICSLFALPLHFLFIYLFFFKKKKNRRLSPSKTKYTRAPATCGRLACFSTSARCWVIHRTASTTTSSVPWGRSSMGIDCLRWHCVRITCEFYVLQISVKW